MMGERKEKEEKKNVLLCLVNHLKDFLTSQI